MLNKIIQTKIPAAFFLGIVAVFAYLLLGGPLPGPVGERYGTYLGALFSLILSPNDLGTLLFRSSLIFLLVFSASWLLLALRKCQME